MAQERVVYDDGGLLDEVVSYSGVQFERLGGDDASGDWLLDIHLSDGRAVRLLLLEVKLEQVTEIVPGQGS